MATNKIPTMLRLPEDLHKKIKVLSAIEHRSMNMEIEYAIKTYLENYEEANGSLSTSTIPEE